MLKEYLNRKSKLSIAIDLFVVVLILLMLIPATRKEVTAFILKPTLFLHQPAISSTKIKVDSTTLNWKLRDMAGNNVTLANFSGQVIVVNLWATWCPPCVAELPDFQELYEKYGDRVAFLFVSNEEAEVVDRFISHKKLNLPVYLPITEYPTDFETKSIPITFVMSKNGEIVMRHTGVAKWNSSRMSKILDALINQK